MQLKIPVKYLWGCGLTVILILFAGYHNRPQRPPTVSLTIPDRNDITSIAISQGARTIIHIERFGQLWLRSNNAHQAQPLDEAKITKFLAQLSMARYATLVQSNATAYLGRYGLDATVRYTITFSTIQGKHIVYNLGALAPNGTHIFILIEDGVYQAPFAELYQIIQALSS